MKSNRWLDSFMPLFAVLVVYASAFGPSLWLEEDLSAEEARYLNRFALISNAGASTRIENSVLTDREIEWWDATLSSGSGQGAFEERKPWFDMKRHRGVHDSGDFFGLTRHAACFILRLIKSKALSQTLFLSLF